jgi:hypothetical protein
MQLRNSAVEGILNDRDGRGQFRKHSERRSARILVDSFNHWHGTGVATLDTFDLYFRLRRLYHLTYRIFEALESSDRPLGAESRERHRALWRVANHYIKVLELILSKLLRAIDAVDLGWRSLHASFVRDGREVDPTEHELEEIANHHWRTIHDILRGVLAVSSEVLPEGTDDADRVRFHDRLVEAVRRGVNGDGNVLMDIDERVNAELERFLALEPETTLWLDFRAFVHLDAAIFPLQFASNTFSRDIISVVRMSPADAKLGYSGGRTMDQKICGRSLGAFGGFLKQPWRSNDILWGRLDGVGQLIEVLVDRERIRARGRGLKDDAELHARLASLFRASSDQSRLKLASRLSRAHLLDDAEFDELREMLARMAQEEIIVEDWPTVTVDALVQEQAWASHRLVTTSNGHGSNGATAPALDTASVYSTTSLAWRALRRRPDRLLVQLAAERIGRGDCGRFDDYMIAGQPLLDEIPKPIVLELASLAAMRLEKSFIDSVPALVRKGLVMSVAYKLVFAWVLPAVHGWARFTRTAPEWGVATSSVLLAASLTTLVLAVIAWIAGVDISLQIRAIMILAPVGILLVYLAAFGRRCADALICPRQGS